MSSAGEKTTTSPRRGEARTQAIRDAAIALLGEVGYDRMTMDTVASRAKASKATIYRRWPDKASLVRDALRRRGSLIHDGSDTGSLRSDLEHYVREALASMTSVDGSLVVALLAVAAHDPELAALLGQQLHHEQLPTINKLIRRAGERREVSLDVDPSIISEVLPGALIMHILVLGLPGSEAFIGHLVDDVLIPLLTVHAKPEGRC
jgi:AcrR family transcriptional regulator